MYLVHLEYGSRLANIANVHGGLEPDTEAVRRVVQHVQVRLEDQAGARVRPRVHHRHALQKYYTIRTQLLRHSQRV